MKGLSLAKCLALLPLLGNLALATSSSSGSCSKTQKCVSGCCSKAGYCGFGPDFCGDSVCISDCDAQAECGPYAPVANTTCPLNVCCSQFGFCGTSDEFCGTGCQSGCDDVTEPSCSGTSSKQIYAGYFEAWNYERTCDKLEPENIDVTPWTHLYYSFAGIDTDDSTIQTVYAHDEEYIKQIIALKDKKPSLKVLISVGGWDLGGEPFSDMVRFPGTRKSFIDSATSFMKKYGFDGIDIDWEYPAASDRGGRDEDKENFVTFMKELKTACDGSYNITATLPSSYWYLKGFDVKALSEYVDHFNFMSYDIHGTWDGNSTYTSAVINPHTNLTEISEGLDLLWRNEIDPSQVLLGLGFYGRSFTLNDTACTSPGCGFDSVYDNGGGNPGECTDTSGILSDYEINNVIERYDPTVVYNEEAAVNWITWNRNQWVSFDNAKTLKQKADFANSKCIGGLFAWSLDEGGPGSLANPNDLDASDTSMSGAGTEGGSDGTGDLYVAASVAGSKSGSNIATGIAPLNIIVAPSTLTSTTTFTIEPLVTPIEVAWTTTKTVTVSGQATVTTTVTRTVQTTTFTIPEIRATHIPWWNWNITGINVTHASTTLFPSFSLDPIVFGDSPNPQDITSGGFVSHTVTASRTLYPPPWPWSTSSLSVEVPTPTIKFTQGGPPGPTCTSGCGIKCTSFCDTPCLLDCHDPKANESWEDPADPDPPTSHSKCAGIDCGENGECTGPYCVKKGCTGTDCDTNDHACLGSNCEVTGCRGSGCDSNGICTDDTTCQTVGCYGDDCNGSGLCLGVNCISLGCIGLDCTKSTGECTGYHCAKISCSGPNCENGECTGEGCTSEDDDCESVEADICTETVYSSMVTPASTWTTETSTSCETITACDAEASTTTTTIESESARMTVTIDSYPDYTVMNGAEATSFQKSMEDMFESIWATDTASLATSTGSSTTDGDPVLVSGTPTHAQGPDATENYLYYVNVYSKSNCEDWMPAGFQDGLHNGVGPRCAALLGRGSVRSIDIGYDDSVLSIGASGDFCNGTYNGGGGTILTNPNSVTGFEKLEPYKCYNIDLDDTPSIQMNEV